MILKQYPTEVLKTWRTSRLGCLYMNKYTSLREDPEGSSQLETIAQILSTRPLLERKRIVREIRRNLGSANYHEDVEQRVLLMGMLNHYISSVMQPNPN